MKTTARKKRFLAPVVGRLVSLADKTVDFPGNPTDGPVVARSTVELTTAGAVVLLFDQGRPDRPIIVGVIGGDKLPSLSESDKLGSLSPREATVDGERVVLSAAKEIVLKCGPASITLTASGKILIRGAYLSSRSSGVNRVKGAAVEIN